MQAPDLLQTIAEVAISLTGFTGVVAVRGHRGVQRLAAAADRTRCVAAFLRSAKVGGSSGARTQDQRIKSPLLYQLS